MGGLQNRSEPFGEEKSVLLLERNNKNNNTPTTNGHIGHCTLTAGSASVKVQNYGHGKCILYKYILETCFVSGK